MRSAELTGKYNFINFVAQPLKSLNPLPYKVFISHSGKDAWVAQQIEKHISICGAETFLDEEHINIGDDFEDKIVEKLRTANEFLAHITPWALNRSYVWMEVGAAWGLGLRQIFVLHGISLEEINNHDNIPILIKKNDCIHLNEVQQYFNQLKERINNYGK